MCLKCSAKPKTFEPSKWTISQVRNIMPGHLFIRSTSLSFYYLFRDLVILLGLGCAAYNIDLWILARKEQFIYASAARLALWCTYWWFQGLTFSAIWIMAHECGHGAFSPYPILNDVIGFILHSFAGTPYFSWKYSHRQHHRFNGHINKDEHWIPSDRVPDKKEKEWNRFPLNLGQLEFIEDTPLFQATKLIFQQLCGFQGYLIFNASGQSHYPRWTNHFNPYSSLFRKHQRLNILLSDIGLLITITVFFYTERWISGGWSKVAALYGIPWLMLNHWITMIVFLQHSDAYLPRYRDDAWTYIRGALVTIDREFLGWQGKFFLHGVAHFHVAHHLFPKMPFYHLEEATTLVAALLGTDYVSCNTSVFRALWDNYKNCQYVDAYGSIVFYKNKAGYAKRVAST